MTFAARLVEIAGMMWRLAVLQIVQFFLVEKSCWIRFRKNGKHGKGSARYYHYVAL